MTKACPYIIGALCLVIAGLVAALYFTGKKADEHQRAILDLTEKAALLREIDSLLVADERKKADEAMAKYRAERAKNKQPTELNELIRRASDSVHTAGVDTLRGILTGQPR